ncbi:MAG: ATP-dependent Clp protease ATP-binding subunit [Bacteroidota bacterium]|nr:ATP-dependent Clp protease ATP-binding subunit [Bacteroidota bacterium]MDP4250831.1 ATP-dependent Clp protease ATP-binding subunit [Bacteroidota bacterium]
MPFREEVKKAISIAKSLAREYRNETFGPAHLLQAILHNEVGLASWLASIQKDIHFMREWAEIRMENYPKTAKSPENPSADNAVVATLELADLIALQLNHDYTDAVSIFTALLKPGVAFTPDQLKTFPVTQKEIMAAAMDDNAFHEAIKPGSETDQGNRKTGGQTTGNALFKYCLDKTTLAEDGNLDPITGRDKELRMVLEVLGRRTKPNVIIVGEPGVGKTALIDGFAQLIVQGKVPNMLQRARLFELDTGALVAGASYKGEVEERIKNIISEIKQYEKAILFIDEIHSLLDSKGPIGTGVVNLLKPELARGELTLIGATTNEEYRKYIESDEAFSRRFEVVRVEEPEIPAAVNMLKQIVGLYESHHGLTVEPDALLESALLAKRYSKDRRLPDSAVDLMDRTMAAIKMMGDISVKELDAIKSRLDIIKNTHDTDSEGLMVNLKSCHRELQDKLSPILLNKLDEGDQQQDADLEIPSAFLDHLQCMISKLSQFAGEKRETVTKQDIAAIISYKTGIPLGKIQSREREKLLSVEDVLKKRVVGQDHAIKAVSEAILESRSGLIKAGQPIASFFLLGPTGTGKTELAKTLADYLFNDESFLIRFDMSEFKEEHSAALLYGAPPGYVGYEEGGVLVNKIREKPYSVVLFDEIEKAHPSVFDIFLQILDEGKLHDRLGKEGDFSNAIILFTSNIGSEAIAEKFNRGQVPATNEMMEIMTRYFRPEFLARLTEIVPFAPISEENVVRIFDIHLRSLTDPLHKQGVSLDISPEAKKFLAVSGFTPKYGARQIKGVIRNQLRRPISRMIIGGSLARGNKLRISMQEARGNDLVWEVE